MGILDQIGIHQGINNSTGCFKVLLTIDRLDLNCR